MVDKYTNEKMFDLELNSNKVVNVKDKYVNLNYNEPTGEAETLVGKKLHKKPNPDTEKSGWSLIPDPSSLHG